MELTAIRSNVRGRKKQIGRLIKLPSGKMGCFVGYCPNEQCLSKIAMDFEEAKMFSRLYAHQKKKLLNRMLIWLLNRLEKQAR